MHMLYVKETQAAGCKGAGISVLVESDMLSSMSSLCLSPRAFPLLRTGARTGCRAFAPAGSDHIRKCNSKVSAKSWKYKCRFHRNHVKCVS